MFNQDVYVNIVGGLRIDEPAVDLAVAVAIASSFRNRRVHPDLAMVGEVGLAGELRSAGQLERRLMEASGLGFTRALCPETAHPLRVDGLGVVMARALADAIEIALRDPGSQHGGDG